MVTSQYRKFLSEATVPAPDTEHTLGPDCLYGLHTSWCITRGRTPRSSWRFNLAMRRLGAGPGGRPRSIRGPAAADYLLASYPELPV